MRTTVDIDAPILRELKALQAREGKSMGRLVSHLLARALKHGAVPSKVQSRDWIAKPMGVRLDLTDKEALHRGFVCSNTRLERLPVPVRFRRDDGE